jgi:hypothetical protein
MSCGCVPVDWLETGPETFATPTCPIASSAFTPPESLQCLLSKRDAANQVISSFVHGSMSLRERAVAKFGELKAVLESTTRAALSSFDAEVKFAVKRLEIEVESAEVLAQQLSAKLRVESCDPKGCDHDVNSSGPTGPSNDVSGLRIVDLVLCEDVLKVAVQSCWLVVTDGNQDWDSDDHKLTLVQCQSDLTTSVRVFTSCYYT